MRSIMFANYVLARQNFFGGLHANSLHLLSMLFTIDSELISQDTDCKVVVSVIIKYLKLKLQTTKTSDLKNT